MASESIVMRNYIETMLEMPWKKGSKDNKDLKKASEILEEDHYGLEKVKERILDYLAVRTLTQKGETPILCLVGPPGTGKTSIAKSIARALNKKYVRISLEAFMMRRRSVGHRKTYVGAMPGRIAEGIRQAGVRNPLMLLDEIDRSAAITRETPPPRCWRFWMENRCEFPRPLSGGAAGSERGALYRHSQ